MYFNSKNINVTVGKEIDILNIKNDLIINYSNEIKEIKKITAKFISNNNFIKIEVCPVCRFKIVKKSIVATIHNLNYLKCYECEHVFTELVLSDDTAQKFFSTNENLSSIYTNKNIIDNRIKQIYKPKLDYVIKTYFEIKGKYPQSILDVGAGGGHFVQLAKKAGLKSSGIEINQQSIDFSKRTFDIDLINIDFAEKFNNIKKYDIITFWGVIEYLNNPNYFIKNAQKIVTKNNGMIFSEVPRYDSVSTTIQKIYKNSSVRHFTPWCRQSCFTDDSLNLLYKRNGFKPVSAWYFGSDAFECAMQLSYAQKDLKILKKIENNLPKIQKKIDNVYMSDSIILAGITI